MKKLIVLTLVAVMALSMMVGCGSEEAPAEEATAAPATEAPAEETPAAEELSGTVNVNGSTSMGDVIAALTEGIQ